jgi:5'-nucleotidase
MDSQYLDTPARLAALLVQWICSGAVAGRVFFNANLPDLPLAEIKGAKITRLASGTHTDAAEEGNDGKRDYYWLVRQKADGLAPDQTDAWAVEQGNISLTPLHSELLNRPKPAIPASLGADLLLRLREEIPLPG